MEASPLNPDLKPFEFVHARSSTREMPMSLIPGTPSCIDGPTEAELRSRVAQVRRQLNEATDAFRQAAAKRDTTQATPLLRIRSSLIRQLLEYQCQLLLSLGADPVTLSHHYPKAHREVNHRRGCCA